MRDYRLVQIIHFFFNSTSLFKETIPAFENYEILMSEFNLPSVLKITENQVK